VASAPATSRNSVSCAAPIVRRALAGFTQQGAQAFTSPPISNGMSAGLARGVVGGFSFEGHEPLRLARTGSEQR
jgi:hypothetical protein